MVGLAGGQVGDEENDLLMDSTESIELPSEQITEIFDQLSGELSPLRRIAALVTVSQITGNRVFNIRYQTNREV